MTQSLLRVAALSRYPVKSLRGHALDRAAIEPQGISGDRRWMIVDEQGRFITRRESPQMAVIDVRTDADGIVLIHPALGTCHVPTPDGDALTITATIWRNRLAVRVAPATVDAFLSAALGRPVRLVHQHDPALRPVDPFYGQPGDHVSLSDGFPLLIATEASLAALNDRLPVPIGMVRFRPNIVIAGGDAWQEDHWRRIRIGAVTLRIVKPCSRCIITTQHPLTGDREQGNDPLTTLSAMGRSAAGGIMFGQNAIADGVGEIGAGDGVEVIEAGESNLA